MSRRLNRIGRTQERLGEHLERGRDEYTYDETREHERRYYLGAADMIEKRDRVLVYVDLPGFEEDDVEVELTDHTLRVVASRETAGERTEGSFLKRERKRASVERTVYLPCDVDAEAATAELDNGVLTVTLPMAGAESATRTIEIE